MPEEQEIEQESPGPKSFSIKDWLSFAALLLAVLTGLGVKFGLNSGSSAEAQNVQATVSQIKDQVTDLKGRCSAIEDRERDQQKELQSLRLELQKAEDALSYATDVNEHPTYRRR